MLKGQGKLSNILGCTFVLRKNFTLQTGLKFGGRTVARGD